jgi:hypothetical protein
LRAASGNYQASTKLSMVKFCGQRERIWLVCTLGSTFATREQVCCNTLSF